MALIARQTRLRVAIIIGSKPNFDEYAFKYFILTLNRIQSTYEFVFPEIDSYYFNDDSYSRENLLESFALLRSEVGF
jgi:hypothetical protein